MMMMKTGLFLSAVLAAVSALSVMPNAIQGTVAHPPPQSGRPRDLVSTSKTDVPIPRKHVETTLAPVNLAKAAAGKSPDSEARVNTPMNKRRRSVELIEQAKMNAVVGAGATGSAPFPVDFVITWFNSDCPITMEAFNKRVHDVNPNDLSADIREKKRFTDAGELKYNLRGLDQYASFYRYIHLVMSDKMTWPSWLNADNPKLKIVYHGQIFDDVHNLPSFNSHAIEANLHRIPGLAEHFVYCNDDMFIHQPTTAYTFFTPSGQARIWTGAYRMTFEHNNAHERAVKHTLEVMEWAHKRNRWSDNDNTLLHQIKPMTKTMMWRATEVFTKEWYQTSSHPFRHKADIWPFLMASVLCVEEGKCAIHPQPSNYFQNLDPNHPISGAFSDIRSQRPMLICLNDSTSGSKGELTRNLGQLFPHPSSFEKGY